ncbi:MAG: tetratricopeptide repeat protein [Pseudomonadota bacterium]
MLGQGDRVTLFGRFRALPKRKVERLLVERGAKPLRDLTRASTHLVIGEGALRAFDAVLERLLAAEDRALPAISEGRLLSGLSGEDPKPATVPTQSVAPVGPELRQLLAAFGLITYRDGCIAFQDAATYKAASGLDQDGMAWPDIVQALLDRREAPKGRHQVIIGANGRAMLQWEDGVTTLSGQHVLPLDEGDGLDDVFEQAIEAEGLGDLPQAERLFETCAQMDRRDAVASFNLGNVRRALGDPEGAQLAFRQAIARDPRLAEAHYNLAGVLEEAGNAAAAKSHLRAAHSVDPAYPEALFNLAQLELADENRGEAKVLFERFLSNETNSRLREKAQQALQLIALARTDAS